MKKILFVLIALMIHIPCFSFERTPYPEFNDDEKVFIQNSATALGLDYGYDFNLGVYSFFGVNPTESLFTDAKRSEGEKSFAAYMSTVPKDSISGFYQKLYQNYYGVLFITRYYKGKKDWRKYNYLNKRIVPLVNYYMYFAEQYLKKNYPDIQNTILNNRINFKKEALLFHKERLIFPDYF